MKKVISWLGGPYYALAVLTVFLAGAFLRLYRLPEFATFLGDQGRDAIVMKNIVTLKDLPALGPITSVGSIYLGPFYYYLMAPWLGLFGLSPVGPAFGVAIISTAALGFQYLAVKDLTDRTTALISIIFSAFSWALIEYARFSWNPNLLAPVSFFAIYSTIKAVRTQKVIWYMLVGALVSCALQLHYLAVFLLPYCLVVIVYYMIKNRKKSTRLVKLRNIAAGGFAFFLVYAPFAVFELIHGFPNLHSVFRFATENSTSEHASKIGELIDTIIKTFTFAFRVDLAQNGGAAAAIVTILAYALVLWWNHRRANKTDQSIMLIAFAFFALLLGTSLYHGPKYPHYLGSIYILLYVLTAYILQLFMRQVGVYAGAVLTSILLLCFVLLNGANFLFLWQSEGHNQIARTMEVAKMIRDMKPQMPYSFTSSPQAYADYPYRYYLTAWNMAPISKEEEYLETKDLIVICEESCMPMKDSQWTIARFSPKRISSEKSVNGVYIYKLTK